MQEETVKLQGTLDASGDLMRPVKPTSIRPEPFVLTDPDPELTKKKLTTPKIKNLPMQIDTQKERKLINDQLLLEQL